MNRRISLLFWEELCYNCYEKMNEIPVLEMQRSYERNVHKSIGASIAGGKNYGFYDNDADKKKHSRV